MISKIQNMFALTRKGARGMLKAAFLTFLVNISFLFPMMIVFYFVDSLLTKGMPGITEIYYYYIPAILVAGVIIFFINYLSYNSLYVATYGESADLRIELANTLKELPLSYFSKHDISDISQTFLVDIATMEHALSHAIPEIIGIFSFLLILGIAMIIASPIMGIAVLAPIVLSILFLLLTKKMQVYGTTLYHKKLREQSETFQQAIEMQQEIKSYSLVDETIAKIEKDLKDAESLHVKTEWMQAGPLQIALILLKAPIALVVFLGLPLVIANPSNLLYFLGYLVAAARMVDAASGLGALLAEIMYITARVERIRELRNSERQKLLQDSTEAKNYDIEFKNVVFSYNEDSKVIQGASFVAKQGEVTALVGPSGCGKTTILRLASRLYDADNGEITLGGKNIYSIPVDELFEKISIVFQDVTLFNTSILENIRIGNKEATDEQVKEAARVAHASEFIEKLPDGYNTLIGENGAKLSGGERQRLSIARAFLKNSPIIILDEISSALDVENEMKIQESLNSLIKDKTVIIISHRLKSVENVDKIIVMKDGKVESEGKHAELIQKSSLYKAMIEKSGLAEKWVY